MKTLKIKSYLVLMLLGLFAACTDEGFKLTNQDAEGVENEAATDSYFDDVDDMAGVALAADDATLNGKANDSGRKITVQDGRFNCDGIVIEIVPAGDSSPGHPKGTITINFGDGCTDLRGNVRKGIIVITYDGRRFAPGSVVTLTFDGYSINDVQLAGVRTVTNKTESTQDSPVFNIQLVGGKATWPDGSSATREVNLTRKWLRANNPLEDSWEVTGVAAGSNRNGTEYTMEITEALLYKRACAVSNRIFIPVAGTKVLVVGDRQMIIDYGDGECDRAVRVTVNGETVDRNISGD